jgi:hypothetical protein
MAVTSLERFYEFIGHKIHEESDTRLSPEDVWQLWGEHEATLSAIRKGLADVAAGDTLSLESCEQEFPGQLV